MTEYHIRKKEREIKDTEVIVGILKSVKYLVVAMCSGNVPYVVVLSSGYDEKENAFYFHCAKEGRKLDIIKDNPDVCATAIEDHGYAKGDCSHKYRSLVVYGKMTLVDSLDDMKHGIRVMLKQLEGEGEEVYKSFIKKDADYNNVAILKLQIEKIDAKGNA
jgi:uncharacterized protein